MKVCAVVLAGGLGTRMRSSTPKLLHPILGKTIIERTLESILAINCQRTIIVLNKSSDAIRQSISCYGVVSIAIQQEPLGTADALKSALQEMPEDTEAILVLNGDSPLIRPETLTAFINLFSKSSCALALLSFIAKNPSEYGRIIRENGRVTAIVENKDANDAQRAISEVNSGVYLINRSALSLLAYIDKNPLKGEYYLTDLLGLCVKRGLNTEAFSIAGEKELMGINNQEELSVATAILRERTNSQWMHRGVTFIDPYAVTVDPEAQIGADTIIYPNVIIQSSTIIGSRCVIYPNTRIFKASIEEGVTIKDNSVIEESLIKSGAVIGPFAHIRPHSVIGEDVKIGNFVEVKKSNIARGVKASHLSYIGDAEIGEGVNIGAGTITCNYDGVNKHRTVIEKDVFVGSDTQLIAPVRVGEGAYIGAGSTITKDVPPNSLGISRSTQRNIIGWAQRKRKKN